MNKINSTIFSGVFSNFSEEITAILKGNLAPKNMHKELCAYLEKDIAPTLPQLSSAELPQKLSKDERSLLLELIHLESSKEMGIIFSFDEDEIGGRTSSNFIEIPVGAGVKEAMSLLSGKPPKTIIISTIYLFDENKAFCGAVALNDLIVTRDSLRLHP